MKKRFLPFSLLLAILVLGQVAIADNGGHYVPRTQGNETSESFMGSLRANQQTGLIDPAWMLAAMQNNEKASNGDLYWLSMGPDNMGGQTTAVLFDNQTNWVYIGSKGGGVYVTYNNGITWHQVGNQNLMVSCLAQDAEGTIYVGTGDGGSKTAEYNGLSQQSYDNSFVGTGVYTIKNGTLNQLASTAPSLSEVSEWSFVNDMAVVNGTNILAATDNGLMYSTDKGESWTMLLEGVAMQVRALSDGTIIASVGGQLFIGTSDNLVCHSEATSNSNPFVSGGTWIPNAAGLLDIAVAPSNETMIYASCVGTDGICAGVYASYDKGEHWVIALPAVTTSQGNNIYGGYGLYNHGIVVDPTNEGRIFVLGYELWKLERTESGAGNYIAENLTTNTVFYSPYYIHVGLHALAFNPKAGHENECYFGTDGGVYKADASNGNFTFSYSNRNYVTTRMFNVAMSGKDTRILAAGIDHGTVLIEGDANTNTLGYGYWINPTGYNQGSFSDDSHAGPCAISTINPKTIFVTTKGGDHIYRSETAGEDWVSTNFTSSSSLSLSTTSFRFPMVLHENYNDALNPATIWYKNTTEENIPSGTTLTCMSNNDYPFEYTLEHTLHAGDSIEIHDPISARLFIAFTDVVYMTWQALDFATETKWYKLTQKANLGFQGEPLSMGLSSDGDNLFVGMKGGRLFRLSNLNTVVDDASGSISDTTGAYQVTTTEITLPTTQCITSIAVDPRDANKVVITLGNYGNDTYVLYSTNALSDEPTFTSKQGNLPKMPVYSSLIEMATGDVILGTEHGIYSTANIASPNWVSDSQIVGDVPVMELKQQLLNQEDMQTSNVTDEGVFVTEYPGVHNTGIIYAATYGRGIFRCENYKQESGAGIDDNTIAETTVSMYPNPVKGEAVVSFNVNGDANVSFQVFDMTGRMVMSQNLGRFAQGNQEVRINMSNLSAGSYILRLNQNSNSSCAKFMVY